jgi:hypothetical protein
MSADTCAHMESDVGWIWQICLGLNAREASLDHRGFEGRTAIARQTLEAAGGIFIHGYNVALANSEPVTLARALQMVPRADLGFAYEGAGMALALLDHLTPLRRDRYAGFLSGPGAAHIYMMHVGAGWALARLRRPLEQFLVRCDPLVRWLVVDGYGFHEGFFHHAKAVRGKGLAGRVTGDVAKIFDQGLGRSLWFVHGACAEALPRVIARFPISRRADLWSGIGLACAYTGGATAADIIALTEAAGIFHAHLAQGAAFAAEARCWAENETAHTNLACQLICGISGREAAAITHAARADLPRDGRSETYEAWRAGIRNRLGIEGVA